MSSCTDTPLSWLTLERDALGELGSSEQATVREHLAACVFCRARREFIEHDNARELAPLVLDRAPLSPEVGGEGSGEWGLRGRAERSETAGHRGPAAPSKASARREPPPARHPRSDRPSPLRGRLKLWHGAATIAAIAASFFALKLRTGPAPDEGVTKTGAGRTKGGDVALTLVREDGNVLTGDAGGTYRSGDRFSVRLTCDPGAAIEPLVTVWSEGAPHFPLGETAARVECGNNVALPGAFRLTGSEEVRVCILWNEGSRVEPLLVAANGEAAAAHSRCVDLAGESATGSGGL